MQGLRGRGVLGCGLVGALTLTACAGARPTPPASVVAPPSAPLPVETKPAVAAPRFLDAPPPDLAPALVEQLAFLSELCPVALHYEVEGAHRISVGCRTCPPFEPGVAAPDGKIAVDGDSFYELELFLPGHFTDANAEQRLAVFNGCEPHSENYGGTLLAEGQGSHFRSLRYAAGLHPSACKAYRRDNGRDVAVCEFGDAHQGISSDSLAVLDFGVDPIRQQTLLSFTNQELCTAGAGTSGVTEEVIDSFEIIQSPVAKNNALIVRVAKSHRVMNEQYQRFCQDENPAASRIERPFVKPQITTRQYRYDGQDFVLR